MDNAAYRMVVSTCRNYGSTKAAVTGLIPHWLSNEGYAVDRLPEGRTDLAPAVTLDRDSGTGRAAAYCRWRLRISLPHHAGTWQTTLLVRADRSDLTWVRLDARHIPGGGDRRTRYAPVPGLAAVLLDTLEAQDGLAVVRSGAATVEAYDVDRVIGELCDEERRLPVVVASTPADVDPDVWARDTLGPAFGQLPGLAILYHLAPGAEIPFNKALEYHRVYGGAVRTYLPGLDPAWRADATRHPVMASDTLKGIPRAAGLLAGRPRHLAVRSPLPAVLDAVPGMPFRSRPEAERTVAVLTGEVRELRWELRKADDLAVVLAARLDDQHDELRRTRGRLAGAAGGCPVTFAELVDRVGDFPHLIFTGNSKTARELDAQDAGTWVRTAWDGLLALQDFAVAAAEGGAGGNFRSWCADPPAGSHAFPPRKAVTRESQTVANNARWRRERTFAVPPSVAPGGEAFMEAHLRIGSGSSVSPRLHYYDDCPRSGRIYIGYIGPHLTNTQT